MYENDILFAPLPELLKMNDGTPVRTAADWEKRKAEYIDVLLDTEYGGMPPEPEYFRLDHVCQGFGTGFDTYRITAGPEGNPISFVLHIYYPGNIDDKDNHDRYPVILTGDGCWLDCDRDVLEEGHRRGYAIATFDRTELAPDMYNTDRDLGIYPLYPELEFSAVSAWAWAYMRCVDALCMLEHIDSTQIALSGHSRGGKTVLLAGALDSRVTYTNPNCSGTHGCGCYRYVSHDMTDTGDCRSEPLCYLMGIVPYWLGPKMKNYVGRETELPYDMHFVKALIAPRYLLETSAYDDTWANPRGSYLTFTEAKKVYELLGVPERAESWYRTGGHRHQLPEFRALMDFIDRKRGRYVKNNDFVTTDPYPGLFK